MASASFPTRFTYTEPTAKCRTICVARDRYLDIVGDPANVSYEWVLRDTAGDVIHHSDCGYGDDVVALRDGLIACCGLPDVETLRELREVMNDEDAPEILPEDFGHWTLQDLASRVTKSNPGALRFAREALETFSENGVEENEASLYLLLLSSRDYIGHRLCELYKRADSNAAAAINLVVEEAKLELALERQVVVHGW